MQTFQASLKHELVRVGDCEPLTSPHHIVEYMLGAFANCQKVESLWVICLAPKRRPINRTCVRESPLVAAMTHAREFLLVTILAEARAVALVRGEPSLNVKPTVHDLNALRRWREAARTLDVELLDYLIVSTCDGAEGPVFRSVPGDGPPA